MDIQKEPLLLRVPAAAKLLDVSRSKLYDLIHQGVVPSIRLGNCLRIPVERLRTWIQDNSDGNGGRQ